MSFARLILSFARSAVTCGVGVFACCLPSAGNADTSLEMAIKATYLTKFAPFIEFPAAPTGSASALCVLDDAPMAGLASRAEGGGGAGKTAMPVRALAHGAGIGGCRILFIAHDSDDAQAVLVATAHAPVLTITDEATPDTRGIVNFVLRDNRVRFEIDDAAAQRHGLKISSKLLGLAVSGVSP